MATIRSFLQSEYLSSLQNRFTLFRWIVIACVILSAALLAPRVALGNSKPTLLLFLVIGISLAAIGLIIFSRWPVLILILTMAGGMFIKYTGPSGLNVSLVGLVALLGLWILEMAIKDHRIKIVRSRAMLPLFILIVLSVLSFGFGQLPWFEFAQNAPLDAQIGGLSIVVFSLVAFLLTANLIKDLRWLQAITYTFIALGAFYILGRVLNWGEIEKIYHTGFSAGSMFWTWLAAMAFSQAFFNSRLRYRWRMLLWSIVLATFYVAIKQAYDWKSGWIPPLAAVAASLGFRYIKPTLLSIPLWSIPAYNMINQGIGSDQYSWGTRLDAWMIVAEIAKANPLTGLGFANYYWYTPLFRIRGYAVRFNSHNQYIDLVAEIGFLGLAALFWFFWEVGWLGWNLRNRVTEGFARAYVYGALGGLVGTLVAGLFVDWFFPFVYNIGLTGFRASVLAWIFLGGLVCIEQITRSDTQPQPTLEGEIHEQ